MHLGPALIVTAHPDDESLFGGILGRFSELGIESHCLCATKGEGSPTNFVTHDLTELGSRRPLELLEAAKRLGIKSVRQLAMPDMPFFQHGTVKFLADADEYERRGVWDLDFLASEIEAYAREIQPEVVFTLLPDHSLTHSHHKIVARTAVRLARANRLGEKLGGVFGSPELAWYPEGSFLKHEDEICFPVHSYSPALGMTYADFQNYGARAHASQGTAYTGLVKHDELLIPLTPAKNETIAKLKKISCLHRDRSPENSLGDRSEVQDGRCQISTLRHNSSPSVQ